LFKRKVPMPVNLNDCWLLWQMGYDVILADGKLQKIVKRKKLLCRAAH